MDTKIHFSSDINGVNNNTKIYKLSVPVELITPKMRVVYPVGNRYGQIQVKLEFSKIKENIKMAEFYNLVQAIEQHYHKKFERYIGKECILKSQISQTRNFSPILVTKVPMINKKPLISIKNENESAFTIYDIKQNDYIASKMYLDIIWYNNDSVTMKWKLKNIYY